jgi:hypothetical protein
MPSANSSRVRSANDLKPSNSTFFSLNNAGLLPSLASPADSYRSKSPTPNP